MKNKLFEQLKRAIEDEANQESNPTIFYQTHSWGGKELNKGIRGVERRQYIDLKDIHGKRILDLGCATGSESIWSYEKGAKKVVGIEQGDFQIRTFSNLVDILNAKKTISVIKHNLENGLPKKIINNSFDTAFCFAITQYIGYRKIWREIENLQVVYVEGGADSTYTEAQLTDELFKATLIAKTPSNRLDNKPIRPLFKLVRK